jgi:uncharacterized protein
MRHRIVRLTLLLLAFALALPAPAAAADEMQPRAEAMLAALVKQDFATAGKHFDAVMQKALPADKLGATWKGIVGQMGPFQKQTAVRREKIGTFDVIVLTCEFAKSPLDVRVTFTPDSQITGLFFASAKPPAYEPPSYVQRDAFTETEVKIGDGELALSGTLSKPMGNGPFPAVVLVHGSGPHDRDETIGPNRPFRDLAWGLASRGIAVLRYEKRTKEHAAKLAKVKTITVKEETVDDAVASIQLLTKMPGIDPKRVFVLGHSLGATVAPWIADKEPKTAGLILLAGSARPMEDLIVEQIAYILSLDGPLSDEAKARIEKLKAQAARVKDAKLSPDTPAEELPLGIPASYWLALRDYRPTEVAAKNKQPMLILQGERDYQVTMVDFSAWKKALAGRTQVTLKSYPQLNHLFAEGTGKSKPTEYMQPTHIAAEVIDDIALWLKKQ